MLKLVKSQEENDSRSSTFTKDTSNESIDFQKSVELFSDTMDSKVSIQTLVPTMQCLELNLNTSRCCQNVELCEDNNNFVIKNGPLDIDRIQEDMSEGRRIVELCEDNNNFVIENGPLDINRIQEDMPEGRRIVDISFMWNEIHRTFNNHARGIECQFKDWKLVSSRRRGLMTQLFFKCQCAIMKLTYGQNPHSRKYWTLIRLL